MDVIADDILRLILERIDSLDLIRAAATCKRWRRTIADAIFLRRFRSLHAHTVAGDYYNNSLFEPTTGTSGGGTLFVPTLSIAARHFSLDFLPGGAEPWSVMDSRGSLLLVDHQSDSNSKTSSWFPQIAVCEPLTRRYMRIPGPPDFCWQWHTWRFRGAYLVDGDEAGCRISMSNFRVVCALQRERWEELYSRAGLYVERQSDVFASAAMSNFRARCALRRRRWDEIYPRDGALSRYVRDRSAVLTVAGDAGWSWTETAMDVETPPTQQVLGRAGGSWYFHNGGGTLVVLDGSTGKFSSSVFPGTEDWDPAMWSSNFCVTDSRGGGEPRIVTVFGDSVRVFARLDDGEWAPEKRILLSEATRSLPAVYQPPSFHQSHYIVSKGMGFVVLSPRVADGWRFSVDLETMEVAPVEDEDDMMGRMAHPCELPWPPVLSACLD